MDILFFPSTSAPPPLSSHTKDSYGNLYSREPENVDSIGREIEIRPITSGAVVIKNNK